MRKRIISRSVQDVPPGSPDWLDLGRVAHVEVTSEDAAHPVELALTAGAGPGWRASQPGEQTIRLLFDEPVRLRHVRLSFHERERDRTQELVLRWSPDGGRSYREIVRQQYNFSPPTTTREVENYRIDLDGVTAIQLDIVPDIRGGAACASLAELRLA